MMSHQCCLIVRTFVDPEVQLACVVPKSYRTFLLPFERKGFVLGVSDAVQLENGPLKICSWHALG